MLTRFLTCFFFGLMVLMNYLANALPLNGKTTGQLSDQYPNLFVPAGITFSIWGIIYLLLLVFCTIQFLKKYGDVVHSIRNLVILNFSLNALWIVCWHYEYVIASLVVMIGLLLSLVYINKSLMGSQAQFFKLTFGVYLGWICIATIANVTAMLVNYNWQGWGMAAEVWTILMVFAGGVITVFIMQQLQNRYIALAVIWGFIGIVLKRTDDYVTIVAMSVISMVFVAVGSIYQIVRQSKAR